MDGKKEIFRKGKYPCTNICHIAHIWESIWDWGFDLISLSSSTFDWKIFVYVMSLGSMSLHFYVVHDVSQSNLLHNWTQVFGARWWLGIWCLVSVERAAKSHENRSLFTQEPKNIFCPRHQWSHVPYQDVFLFRMELHTFFLFRNPNQGVFRRFLRSGGNCR